MTRPTDIPPVAFLGMGAMGRRMAMRLLRAGFPLTVWNRTAAKCTPLAEAGARVAATPAAAAHGAAFVFVMVEGDAASRAIWDGAEGLSDALATSTVAIECSTLSMERIRTLEHEAQARGRRFIEAPVSGSLPQAEAGTLTFLAGGAETDIAHAAPLLEAMGSAVHRLGIPPAATAAKLAINAMLAAQVVSLSEALGFLAREGIGPGVARHVLADTPVASPIVMAAVAQIVAGDFAPLFPISLMAKDLGYLAAAAAARGSAMPVAAEAQALFETSRAQWSDLNVSAVSQLFLDFHPSQEGT